jgi:hypothetical protein
MVDIKDLVEVTLNEKDDFLKVRETLTSIGVASKKDKTLFQSSQHHPQTWTILCGTFQRIVCIGWQTN